MNHYISGALISLLLCITPAGTTQAAHVAHVERAEVACPICLDGMNEENQTLLPCRLHNMHTECLRTYCKNKVIGGQPGSCPSCRVEFQIGVDFINRLNLQITDEDVWKYLTVDWVDSCSPATFGNVTRVLRSFLQREESLAEIQSLFNLSEEEATIARNELSAFFDNVTIEEVRNGTYLDRLQQTQVFPIIKRMPALSSSPHKPRTSYRSLIMLWVWPAWYHRLLPTFMLHPSSHRYIRHVSM